MKNAVISLKNKLVTIMGLGVHGGGAAAARHCANRGARVTVTDLRDESVLDAGLKALGNWEGRLVLGEHREEDFLGADVIVKNPAVPRNAALLTRGLESGALLATDISLLFAELAALITPDQLRIIAVTGTKGKSSTASAIHHALLSLGCRSFLGGNITISPLGFIDELLDAAIHGPTYLVLELSSFQIGDLKMVLSHRDDGIFRRPDISILTNMMPDHLDYYSDMNSYVADKAALFAMTAPDGCLITGRPGQWEAEFARAAAGRRNLSLAGISELGLEDSLPADPLVPGAHQRENFALAAMALAELGFRGADVAHALERFPGVDHRLQYIGCIGMHRVYNDSAATIPQAALAAVGAFAEPVHLICGGSDKQLDLSALAEAVSRSHRTYLLAGTATDILINSLSPAGKQRVRGPFDSIAAAVSAAADDLSSLESPSVLTLSPGCASFGMFLNEFDRGRKFVAAVQALPDFKA
jgi:UDP-N-acetylmuramoylalanine--D-glutamate ligase